MQEYKARLRLKSDTEANWIAANEAITGGFIPLDGEIIIYSADNEYTYSRLKIGDGSTNVINLPFIDAGSLSGKKPEIVKLNTFDDRPQQGSPDKLYVDVSTGKIYHYDVTRGYLQLAHLSVSATKTDVSKIISWRPGVMTGLTVDNNVLKVSTGLLPELVYYDTEAVDDIK